MSGTLFDQKLHLVFTVWGKPEPAGSKKAIPLYAHGRYLHAPDGRPIVNVVDDNDKAAEWKRLIKRVAIEAYPERPLTGPVRVAMRFFMVRPQSHYRKLRAGAVLRDDAPMYHVVKPDVTKLVRAAEDALSGIVWVDDCQVIGFVEKTKQYGDKPRVEIEIFEV